MASAPLDSNESRRLLELARADVVSPAAHPTAIAPIVEQLEERYRADGLDLRVEQPAAGSVRMEPETLESILTNLIDNARRHGGDGDAVSLDVRPEAERVALTVADDGPGISAANASRVFDAFFTTARPSGGTGVGLSIVRALVDAHGGNVTLDSAPGRTVFRISLPG